MSVEVLQMMAKCFYISAGFFSCVVLCVFFRFRIWEIFGDLSGVRRNREIQVISKLGMAQEDISQRILGMSLLQEEETETFVYTEDTGVLEVDSVQEAYCVRKKMEYIGSEKWIA